MSNLQTYYHFKLDFQKVEQYTWGKWLIHAPNTARTISCKAWNSPVEYHDVANRNHLGIDYILKRPKVSQWVCALNVQSS